MKRYVLKLTMEADTPEGLALTDSFGSQLLPQAVHDFFNKNPALNIPDSINIWSVECELVSQETVEEE